MARHKLTDSKVRSALPGWHGDGDGLWLRVSPTGSRSWVFVTIRRGRRREMGLGPYGSGTGQVSLAAARAKAEQVREILGRGGDPFKELPERRDAAAPRTFGQCADDVLATKLKSLKHEKHREQWTKSLTVAAGSLRKLPVSDVRTDDVVRVLRPIWDTTPEMASRLRGRIEAVLDYAKAVGLREGENPARWKGHLDHILGERKRLTRGHHAAMPWRDLPEFMERLRLAEGYSARALEFAILTAARTGEVLLAEWSEIDLDAGLWTVPAARMKMKREHVVPLSPRALEVARWLHEHRLSNYVFPGQRPSEPLSNMTLKARLKRMGVGEYTPHGFRSSFRDWAGDATDFPRDLAEQALAHKVGDATENAYRRSTAIERRRRLMEAWAQFCHGATEPRPAVLRSA